MKKTLLAVLVGSGVLLFASDAELKRANEEYYQTLLDFNFAKAESFYHPDYAEFSGDRKTLSYQEVIRQFRIFALLLKAASPDGTYADVIEAQALSLGHSLTAKERALMASQVNQVEAQRELELFRQNIQKEFAARKILMQKLLQSYQVVSCNVTKDRGELLFRMQDPKGNGTLLYHTVWRKTDGKWQVIESRSEKKGEL